MYDEEAIRDWAYDPNREFIDSSNQDEDLTLALVSSSILLPLIDDPGCPKGDYLLACLDGYYRDVVLIGHDHAEVRQAAAVVRQQCSNPTLQAWADVLDRRLSYRAGIGKVDRQLALEMGQDLLNSVDYSGQVVVYDESPVTWRVELSFPNPHYREWLEISKATGEFKFSKSPYSSA